MATVTVSARMTLPATDFGSLTYEATWTDDLDTSRIDQSTLVTETAKRLHNDLAMLFLPLVEAEITHYLPSLLKDHDPDAFMRRNSDIYRTFVILNPDIIIPAMGAIVGLKAAYVSVSKTFGPVSNPPESQGDIDRW